MTNLKVLGVIGLVLIVGMSVTVAQENVAQWGTGILCDYNIPAFGFKNWYSGANQLGGRLIIVSSPNRALELEYQHVKFTDGAIVDKEFMWAADQNYYASPEASAEMTMNSVVVNAILYSGDNGLTFSAARYSPYLVIGGGFYRCENSVSGLIYPGQRTEPLDPNIKLAPYTDSRTALGANIGLGVEAFVTDNVAIDLRARYNFIVGEIRPMNAWGLDKVFPLQSFSMGAALKFYFWK